MDARLMAALLLLAACNRQAPDTTGGDAGTSRAASEASGTLAGQVPESVIVTVNEPFLNATVGDGVIVVQSPDHPDGRHFTIAATAAARSPDAARRSWGGSGEAGDIRIEVTSTACTDSMSGAHFPYSGSIELNGARHEGCARAAGTPPPGKGK